MPSISKGANALKRHYLRADAVEEVVKSELRQLAGALKHNEENFARLLLQKNDKERENEQNFFKRRASKSDSTQQRRFQNLYEKLYEDNVMGKVSDEWFAELSHKYETERMNLKSKLRIYAAKSKN